MDENGRLPPNGLHARVISYGTHVTKSEFSHNASKVKGVQLFGAENRIDSYNIAFYIKKCTFMKNRILSPAINSVNK